MRVVFKSHTVLISDIHKGKRQRLVVLRLIVNQFPCGKHCRFNSYFPHVLSLPMQCKAVLYKSRAMYNTKITERSSLVEQLSYIQRVYGSIPWVPICRGMAFFNSIIPKPGHLIVFRQKISNRTEMVITALS